MKAEELERRLAREGATPEVRSRGAVQVRAIDDGDTADTKGRFEAIVSVFGNVDSYGDRILKGFFEESLKEDGFPPIVWTHQWSEPPIGLTEEAEEAEGVELLDGRKVDGLRLLYRLLVDDNARAREVDAAQRAIGGDGLPALREYSFAFFVKEERNIYDDDDFEPVDATHWRDLIRGQIVEAGPTLIGANSETGPIALLSALSRRRDEKGSTPTSARAARLLLDAAPALAQLKAGAVLSAANRGRLERAIESLQEIVADADGELDDDEKNRAAGEEQRRADVLDLLLDVPATTPTYA